MASHVRNVSYIAGVMCHEAIKGPSPHCTRAAEIFYFRLIRIHSNAGNSIYALLPCLFKPYPDTRTGNFQCHARKAGMIVEVAFGRLKGRFWCLLKTIDTTLKYLPAKITSCVVLCNLCEMREEVFSKEWLNKRSTQKYTEN